MKGGELWLLILLLVMKSQGFVTWDPGIHLVLKLKTIGLYSRYIHIPKHWNPNIHPPAQHLPETLGGSVSQLSVPKALGKRERNTS